VPEEGEGQVRIGLTISGAIALGAYEGGALDLTPDETARIDELSERRERDFDPPFAPDWRD
jgi:hypothetical protein